VLVVNLFGVPGAGKSTGAAYIFSQLKMKGINCELVQEFVKDKVYEENKAVFNNQAYIFGKQYFRISRLQDKVDAVITDSPILLSSFYNNDTVLGEEFDTLTAKIFHSYESLNYLIARDKPYNPVGRFQSEQESDNLIKPMMDFLYKFNVDYSVVAGNITGYNEIIVDVLDELETQLSW
jgi:hypothetical protein